MKKQLIIYSIFQYWPALVHEYYQTIQPWQSQLSIWDWLERDFGARRYRGPGTQHFMGGEPGGLQFNDPAQKTWFILKWS